MNYIKSFTCILIFVFVFIYENGVAQIVVNSANENHLIKNEAYRRGIAEMLVKQKELVKGGKKSLFDILKTNLETQEREALEFLYAFMPLSDLADYDGTYYLDNVKTTLKVLREINWVKDLPEEIFLHFVLPIRVNNENLDYFRVTMYDELKNRVKGLSMKDAALEINHWCHEKVTYRPSDSRTSSPLSTMRTSWGRCGEESVFTVEALRTIGIPARQVYTPRWAHTDDNHAWVEVWVDGKWKFLGACEPDPDLNMGWFAEPSRRTMVVHTRAYGKYLGSELVINSNDRFSELNLIGNYAPSKAFTVKVIGDDNNTVENAKVEYRLYNYCEFFPLAKTFTDKNGITKFSAGLGDLLIWASKENKYGFQKISVGNTDTVEIRITINHPKNYSLEYDLIPPVQPIPRKTPESSKNVNQYRLLQEDSIRQVYNKSFKDSAWVSGFANKLYLNPDSLWNIFKKTYGNWNEISKFLEKNNTKYYNWILRYLYSISEKDLRDIEAKVLNDHLMNGFTYSTGQDPIEQSLYTDYVLSPRIGLEYARPWRSFLQSVFDSAFAQKAQGDISVILDWIKNNIKIDNDANTLSRCPLSPRGVYELRVSDSYSRSIFLVALCRSLCIPSRINSINNIPQYYSKNKWQDVLFEKQPETKEGKGFIRFINATPDLDPRYYSNFTIGKFNNGVFETLEFDEDKPLSKFAEKTEVDEGNYMMVTGSRIKDGSVLSVISFFEVKADESTEVKVKVRTINIKPENIGSIKPGISKIKSFSNNKNIPINSILKGNGAIFIWMDPDKEPTKHVMNDLPAFKEKFDEWGGSFVFLLSKENLSKSFDPNTYKNLPLNNRFIFDIDNSIISQIEKIKNRSLRNSYPVITACDTKGNILFYSEGYTIGIGDQLSKIIKFLK